MYIFFKSSEPILAKSLGMNTMEMIRKLQKEVCIEWSVTIAYKRKIGHNVCYNDWMT